jgi:poly(3-hydroxybutyrate) depolymerase
VKGAGHYGIFSGRRWRDSVYPQVRDFIARFHDVPGAPAQKAPARKAVAAARRSTGLARTSAASTSSRKRASGQ